jgi:ferredoxin-NADP reductase
MTMVAVVLAVVVVGGIAVWLMGRGGGSAPAIASSAPAHLDHPVQSWKVTNVTKETPLSVSFEVDATMTFAAGQFVLIRPNAELPWRAYSYSRAPSEPLRLTVKQVANGQVSTHITQKLQGGDVLEVKGPYGQFVLPAGSGRVLMLAGGSGVTPMISMLRDLRNQGWPRAVTLVDANRNAAEIILKGEIEELVASAQGKLSVVYVLDDATDGLKGPLTADALTAVLKNVETPEVVALCGPTPMMDAARGVVAQQYPSAKLLEEKFSADTNVAAGAPTHTATLVQSGKSKPFSVREGEAVLQAARKAKVSLQAGCEMGACGTCRVKVLSGGIETPTDACLSDEERAQGYALVCVGKLKRDVSFEPAP